MKKICLVIFMMTVSMATFSQPRPKLLVGIAVDQMRWDYLYRFYDEYTDGGFKRMMNEGFSCDNCEIDYIPSITAIGHTSIFTGSVPSIHGIAGNTFILNGRQTYCCEDTTVQTVGSDWEKGKRSPRNLRASTIGDELKIATDWKARVVGVSFKDRAAIFPAGNGADAAYWFDTKNKRFVTSTYYMNQLPKWVEAYNRNIRKNLSIDEIQYEPYGNDITAGMAEAVIRNERLGQHDVCDMLTLSFSCPDITGHKFGTHSEKTHAQYIELDKRLKKFFTFLDKTIGKGQYLVFLTADHGAANSAKLLSEHRIPAGEFHSSESLKSLNNELQRIFPGTQKLAKDIADYKVVLDHKAIAAANIDEQKVRQAVVAWGRQQPEVMYAVDLECVQQASIPALIREKIINGYWHERTGDIQLILKPQYVGSWRDIGYGTSHGLWNSYDCHIPFLLMGWGVEHGSTKAECHITDIAPTVCALINIQKPSGAIGNAVIQVTK